MCGIVGMAGLGVGVKDHDVFEDLMRVSVLRGKDATGIAQARLNQRVPTSFIEKKTIDANAFFDWVHSKQGNKLILKSTLDDVYIGHCRWATKGAYTTENAHPFRFKHIIGVHNGTLTDWKYYDKDGKSDSYMLYKAIADEGYEKVIPKLDDSNAYAPNWIDLREKLIYFVRNKERPLFVTHNKDRRVAYWASEAGMLRWILDRNKINYWPIKTFTEHKIYCLDIKDMNNSNEEVGFTGESYTPPAIKVSTSKKGAYADREWWNSIFGEAGYDLSTTGGVAEDDDIPFEPDQKPTSADTTTSGPSTSVIPAKEDETLPHGHDLKYIVKKSGKIPHYPCVKCNKELNLLDQFFANKQIVNNQLVFECIKCDNLSKSVTQTAEDAARMQ